LISGQLDDVRSKLAQQQILVATATAKQQRTHVKLKAARATKRALQQHKRILVQLVTDALQQLVFPNSRHPHHQVAAAPDSSVSCLPTFGLQHQHAACTGYTSSAAAATAATTAAAAAAVAATAAAEAAVVAAAAATTAAAAGGSCAEFGTSSDDDSPVDFEQLSLHRGPVPCNLQEEWDVLRSHPLHCNAVLDCVNELLQRRPADSLLRCYLPHLPASWDKSAAAAALRHSHAWQLSQVDRDLRVHAQHLQHLRHLYASRTLRLSMGLRLMEQYEHQAWDLEWQLVRHTMQQAGCSIAMLRDGVRVWC
jgi:hypothetical protein